jgi:hypothetical protein
MVDHLPVAARWSTPPYFVFRLVEIEVRLRGFAATAFNLRVTGTRLSAFATS